MGWVYKLKSIEHEIPAAAFFRDLMMFARQSNGDFQVSKTAAALNYWLQYERFDLPLAITKISHASYNDPITADGTLPIRLFGKALNLKRLKEKKIPWLICYGIHDDLVEKETALAPTDHVEAEVTPFPKGHVAIATSWSHPDSDCGLHTRFGEGKWRGPVRFHMDLEADLAAAKAAATKVQKTKTAAGKAKVKDTAKKATTKKAPARTTKPKKASSAAAKAEKATAPKPKRATKSAKATPATPKKKSNPAKKGPAAASGTKAGDGGAKKRS
jgi:hypothetical protein